MSNSDDDIVNGVLLEFQRIEQARLAEKESKKRKGKDRDLDQARLYQHGYIEREKLEGRVQVGLYIDGDNIVNMDNEIVSAAKEQKKLKRSDVVNAALKFYFEKKNNNE